MSDAKMLLEWWGASLSTVLAIVKLWEAWRDRSRTDVSSIVRSDAALGNSILVRNLSNRPVILEYWVVTYCSGHWRHKKFEDIAYADHDVGDQKIDAHSSLQLDFSEENYFSCSSKVLKGRKIYIRLFFAGRKPVLKLVYPQ